jgi:alkylation response protein AidB-like acyl-CoA dehydrogenase
MTSLKERDMLTSTYVLGSQERLYICIGANAITRSVLKDAMAYAHKRAVFQGKLIDQGVSRYKLGHMSRVVESQQAWIEQIVYQMDNMPKADGDRLLGGTTAIAKANCGIVSLASSFKTFNFC